MDSKTKLCDSSTCTSSLVFNFEACEHLGCSWQNITHSGRCLLPSIYLFLSCS